LIRRGYKPTEGARDAPFAPELEESIMTAKGTQGGKIITLALGLGVMVLAAQAGEDAMKVQAAGGPVRCDIQVKPLGGGVELQGVVFANSAIHGAYELQVSKSGGGGTSNINQGGAFNARPDEPAKLGVVTLGGDKATYRAQLKVMWDGQEIECEKTVGGGWL
jgi:hypothetical protein